MEPSFLALWAKSGDPPHRLLGHMLDTAAVATVLLEREPSRTLSSYAREMGLGEEAAARFLAAVVGLHDLGKASPAFQRQWPQGQQRVEQAGFTFALRRLPARLQRPLWVPHGAITEALVHDALLQRDLADGLARDIARCLGAHHGFTSDLVHLAAARTPAVAGQGMWDTARSALVDHVWHCVGVREAPRAEFLGSATALGVMALASICDWIASDEALFPYGRDLRDPAAYWADAVRLASRALDVIGWHPRRPLAPTVVPFERVFPFAANALQRAVRSVVEQTARQSDEPLLLVVEAPMGTGKTEAALWAHLALQAVMGHRGLYMALPTMATGNGLYPRVREWLERMGRQGDVIDLQLQHGTAWLHAQYRPVQPQQVGDQGGPVEGSARPRADADSTGAVRAAAWFSAARRAMLSEYGVGTVDQALLGVLRVRHHFVRLWGLGNRTVVLDEVHAYDTYTSGLIAALLRWLRALGSSVILMSATLPRSRRQELIQAYAGSVPSQEAPYPRITAAGPRGVTSVPVPVERRRCVEIRPAPLEVESLASTVLEVLGEAGCAACVVNTVDRAQRLYAAFGQGEPLVVKGSLVGKRVGPVEVYLLHARFPSGERQDRESVLLQRFGKDGYRTGTRPRRSVVVATQVIEQSLDLDFDLMFTDLAPVDLLLQRSGRLHRFDLSSLSPSPSSPPKRPGAHRKPRLWLSGMAPDLPDLERGGWVAVYDPFVLMMTWWVLRDRPSVELPDDLERLVDAVYEGGPPSDLPPALHGTFERAYRHFTELLVRQSSQADMTAVRDPSALLEAVSTDDQLEADRLDDDEDAATQAPLTRYGPPSVSAILLHRVGGTLYLDPEGVHGPVDVERRPSDEMAKALLQRSVRLGHPTVYHAVRGEAPPIGWRAHPLLHRTRLVVLEGGACVLGSVRLRLDPELGVIYEHQSA